jgi:predicted GNAT family N-acyltransferase
VTSEEFAPITGAAHRISLVTGTVDLRISSRAVRKQGLGELLRQNAIKRILRTRNTLGIYAVVVEAKDAAAEAFYRKYGFRLCDLESKQLYLPLGAE